MPHSPLSKFLHALTLFDASGTIPGGWRAAMPPASADGRPHRIRLVADAAIHFTDRRIGSQHAMLTRLMAAVRPQ
jgi:hypothetical protein